MINMSTIIKNKVCIAGIILSALLIAVLFLYLFGDKEPESKYNLVDRFFEAEHVNFDRDDSIEDCLPDRKYNLGPVISVPVNKILNSAREIDSPSDLSETADKDWIIRVTADMKNNESLKLSILYDYKDKNNYSEIQIQLSKNNTFRIANILENNKTIYDDFTFESESLGKSVLKIAQTEDYLFIFDERRILYQQKASVLARKGSLKINPDSQSYRTKMKIKYSVLPDDFLKSVTTKPLDNIPEHKFNINTEIWNELHSEHEIVINNQKSDYLRRLKRGPLTTRAIYFRPGMSLRYELLLTQKPMLEFNLNMVKKYVIDPARMVFTVEVQDLGDEKKAAAYSYNMSANSTEEIYLGRTYINLNKFSNAKVSIKFSFSTIDGKTNGNEDRIILALASPVISNQKHDDDINVVFILLDTVRADHLGCYGYERNTSQVIDKLAKEGTICTHAIASAPWTLPSHMSMFTSYYPEETGFILGESMNTECRLATNLKPLPEYLAENGFKTAAITGSNFISSIYGFDRGFDIFFERPLPMATAVDESMKWMKMNKDRKFFLFFHTYETHEPYLHDAYMKELAGKQISRRDEAIARYDSGIRFADHQVGRIIRWLKKNNLYKNTLIIVTSDHGENFDKIKRDLNRNPVGRHGYTLSHQEINIPLVMAGLSSMPAGNRIDVPVTHVDLMPTILDILSIDYPESIRGKNIFEITTGNNKKNDRLAFSQATVGSRDMASLQSTGYKLLRIRPRTQKSERTFFKLYDVKKDLNERIDIKNREKKLFKLFQRSLNNILKSIEQNRKNLIYAVTNPFLDTSEHEENLRNLGYLN